MFFYLILTILALIIFHFAIRYGRVGMLTRNIATADPILPIFGNVLLFIGLNNHSTFNMFRDLYKKYNPIVKLWSFTFPTVLIWDPADVKVLLTDKENINKGTPYRNMQFALKSGLVTSAGEKWVQRRKLLNPAFHVDVLKKYLDVANIFTKKFINDMADYDDDTVHNFSALSSKLILLIMTETSTGVSHKFFEEKCDYFEKLIKDMEEIVAERAGRPYIENWMIKLTPLEKRQNDLSHQLDSFTNSLIEERRKYHESTGYKYLEIADVDSDDSLGKRKKFATLDLLFALERKGLIDKEGILEELNTITAASHDTTAITFEITLLLLAENEEVQEIARNEAIEVLDNCNKVLTMDDIKKLEYIDRCVKESLRVFPPVHIVARTLSKDLQLKDHIIPRGADMAVPIYDIHRNPKYWPDPLKYDPDRFLPDRIQSQHPYAYVPFSAGPRNCIGQKLATFTLKALIAHILYNFKVLPVTKSSELNFDMSVVLKKKEPIYLRFIKLNKN